MKPETKTLSAQVHDAILEMIIDAGVESENMLLTERELVERFGVSKAPVREALLRLCAEEVLTSIPRCGYVVVRVGEKSGRDNRVVRQMLELQSLSRYFDYYTPQRLDELEASLQQAMLICRQDSSIWTLWQTNTDFHCALIATTGNPYLVKHLRNCIDVEGRFYAQNHYLTSKNFMIEHDPEAHGKILDAIRQRDKELALQLLEQDISYDLPLRMPVEAARAAL